MCYQAEHIMVYYCDDESCRLPLQETNMLFCCLVETSTTGIGRYRPVDPNTVYCPRGFTGDPEPAISNYPYDGPQPGLCPLHRLAAESEAAAYQQQREQERQDAKEAAMALEALQEQDHREAQAREQEAAVLEAAQSDEELEEELAEELVEDLDVDTEVQSPQVSGIAEQYMAILQESGGGVEAEHWLRWRQDMNF